MNTSPDRIDPVEHPLKFRRKLLAWYRRHRRDLPWRKTKDPYRIWISEIMLQQTTVQAVIPYYEKWMRLYPDLDTLGKSSLQRILKSWEGLGYYQRARNIHQSARLVREKFHGEIPNDYNELRSLPGFGPYTTAAVLSIAFGGRYPVVDGNVRRVLMRIRQIEQPVSGSLDRSLEEKIAPLLPMRGAGDFNQAMMELGARICRPRNPSCLACPIIDFCLAQVNGRQELIPPSKKMLIERFDAAVAVLNYRDRYFIQKRPSGGILADLWEFPGGKINPGETPDQGLRREIKEELGIDLKETGFLTKVKHSYTQFEVTLHVYLCKIEKNELPSAENRKWVTLRGMRRFPFPSGSTRIIRFLENMPESNRSLTEE